jgi:hypothetical protein
MNWSQYGPAVLAAFLGATLTDVIFSGIIVGRIEPSRSELWRPWVLSHRFLEFALSRIWTALTCSVFLFCCGFFGLTSLQPAVMLAIGSWLSIALPLIAQAAMVLRLPFGAIFGGLAAWLAKLLICAGAAYYLL